MVQALNRAAGYFRGELGARGEAAVHPHRPLPRRRDLRARRAGSSSCCTIPRSSATSRRTTMPRTGCRDGTMRRKKGEQGRRLAGPRQAGRPDLDPGRQRREAHLRRAEGRPRRHARSAGDRHPADRPGRGDQDRALRDGRAEGLPLHPALGRGARDRRRRGRGGRRPPTCARATRRSAPSCPQFTGEITQVPPAYSAVKVEGERAYDLARAARRWSWRRARSMIRFMRLLEPAEPGRGDLRGRSAARAPTCAPWPAIWQSASGLSAISATCGGPRSGRSPRQGDFAGSSEGPGA